jgi:hypothetical protein
LALPQGISSDNNFDACQLNYRDWLTTRTGIGEIWFLFLFLLASTGNCKRKQETGNADEASGTFRKPSNTIRHVRFVGVQLHMKDLTRSLLTFVIMYGTKDRTRFEKYAASILDKYGVEELQQRELIAFAYDFFNDLGQRFNQIDIISRGVHSGVGDLEKKLEAITAKLEAIQSNLEKD